ncbi:hypothetical protein Pogu_2481 [Pyrobaculum oguniense TE7]|uniref:Uncharacterized protein n=1 Tax=Pyrobaculum oguniense (strain DSM 13380 / JCM 10595 / TE7) TaxID=698757 RepID=H6QDN7_PYROT|nr:hypothetical protein Pogu_2481 [Pyrobaculum oguniense TE7]
MPQCAVCKREVNFKNISYIHKDIFVCKECFPQFYIKNICKVIEKRLRGESPVACIYCAYKKQCDSYVSRTIKALS